MKRSYAPGAALGRVAAVTVASILLVSFSAARDAAAASKAFSHDGFYLSLESGPGALWVQSSGSISHGFEQELSSKASAWVLPATSLSLGGTFEQIGLVLGGRLGMANGVHPVIETLDQRFKIPSQHIVPSELGVFASYYPDLQRGMHFGASLALATLVISETQQGGPLCFSGSLEAGHGFFVARQWSLGATLRTTAGHCYGRDGLDVSTTFFMPTLLATLTLH